MRVAQITAWPSTRNSLGNAGWLTRQDRLTLMQLVPPNAGDSSNIAYLANVCVSEAARRCRVGEALIQHARQLAHLWGDLLSLAAIQHGLLHLRQTLCSCSQLDVID